MNKLILGLVAISICLIVGNAFAMIGIDDYTVLMLHSNGADGSTDFVDSSSSNHTVTAIGNSQIDTSQYKFGGASGLFDGNGDYLTIPDSTDWYFGSGDFTIDLWGKFNSIPTGTYSTLVSQGDGSNYWLFSGLVTEGIHRIYFLRYHPGEPYIIMTRAASSDFEMGTWYHLALVRNGNIFRIYRDGIQVGPDEESTITMPDLASNLNIAFWDYYTGQYLDGWMDEVRISKGISRWTSNFTPPTSEYEVVPEKVIPESPTLSILGLGLLGLVFKGKKKVAF